MKRLIALLFLVTSSSAFAGEYHRGHHSHHRGHHAHKVEKRIQHHRRHKHRLEHVVGGVILGAVLHEIARPTVRRETVVVERAPSYSYEPSAEFLLDDDGRCYSVSRYENRKVLTEVPAAACSRY